jgi:hypothetical protein
MRLHPARFLGQGASDCVPAGHVIAKARKWYNHFNRQRYVEVARVKRRQTSGGSRRGLDSEICTALSASLSAFLIYIRELTIGLGFNLHAKVLFPSACERSRYSGSRRCGASRCGEACARAVQRIPGRLRKAIRHNATNHLATEVSNGERTLYVIRGKIIVERR